MYACILMCFGPCGAGAVVEFCEAESVDAPAAAVLCGTKTVGVPATVCGLETAGVSSLWSNMILIAKYNVHANSLVQCFNFLLSATMKIRTTCALENYLHR